MQFKTSKIFDTLQVHKYVEMLPDLKQEKTKQIAVLTFTLVALAFFGLLAINPTLSTIAKLKKELADSKFVDGALQEKITNISLLQKSYADIENDLSYVTDAIPTTAEAPLLAAQIQGLAQEKSVEITNLQIFEVEVAKSTEGSVNYNSFSFSLSATGSKEDVLAFIEDLGKMQRVVTFDSISFTSDQSSSDSLQVNLKGLAYFKN